MISRSGIRLSSVVMTHPTRRKQAQALLDDHPELGLRMVLDPLPDATASALRTARLAWAGSEAEVTHHLVVQDDVALSPGFAEDLLALIADRPADVLCLYVDWGSLSGAALRIAAMLGHAWSPVVEPGYVPTVGMVMPAALASEFAASHDEPGHRGIDDVAMLDFLRERGITPLTPVGRLLEHEGNDSLVGNARQGRRHAATAGGVDLSRTGVLPVPDRLAHMLWTEGEGLLCVRDPSARKGWRYTPVETVLRAANASPAKVFDALRQELESSPSRDRMRDLLSIVLARELWLTGILLGHIAADEARRLSLFDDCDDLLANPTAAAALARLAPGAVRRFVPDHLLGELTEVAEPLVHAAVRLGWNDTLNTSDAFDAAWG
ncbi:hypothetical protein [Streptomyces sp. MW-W600-10]|uniref:hypothetical protein n=1 Tax=Streptomyces sp. MW-W600-10 TaxID=2829819 RepID=UPI001C46AF4E|nr:hypothetical protein [Streptomyces sp. MW-W600-10]MBV7245842.1 hypothetical protein [Streptomyces sp. MW-W600-10]